MTTTTTYPVIVPPQSPPVPLLKKGDKFDDQLTVVAVANPREYNIYDCWDCGRGFQRDTTAVIVTFEGDPDDIDPSDILALHKDCAEDYRRRAAPMVVTVHPDGTASVTGPGGHPLALTTVTVVVEDQTK